MEFRFADVRDNTGTHSRPPSFVSQILPFEPTANPISSVENVMSFTSSRPPSESRCQLSPPSSVLRMRPFSPTAQPVYLSLRQTDTSLGFVRTLNGSHDLPASPVSQTIPLLSVIVPFSSSPKD